MTEFLQWRGNYKNLIMYQKSEAIYDITYHFAHRFLSRGDRTIDQMVQAARSCKQNIVEGVSAATTSRESEIKLINVAKASLHELLEDFKDYLRVNDLSQWQHGNPKFDQTRAVCKTHNDSSFYRERIPSRSAEVIANTALIIGYQLDMMLFRYLQRIKDDFLKNGGIREEMSRARRDYRNSHQN